MRVRTVAGKISQWYPLVRWPSPPETVPDAEEEDEYGRMATDTIMLHQPTTAFQYGLTPLFPDQLPADVPSGLSFLLTDTATLVYPAPGDVPPPPRVTPLPVPYRSQADNPPDIRWRVCLPTAAAMVLHHYGQEVPTLVLADRILDRIHGRYGHWAHAVAAVSEYGGTGWVARLNSWDPIVRSVQQGYPVLISIAFSNGSLHGAPMTSTAGHFLVVAGFDGGNRVLCLDPAHRNAATGVVWYDIYELSDAWLGHGGTALFLLPPGATLTEPGD